MSFPEVYDSAAAKSAVYQQPEHLSRPGIKAIHPDTPVPRDSHFYSGSEKTKFNNEPAVNPVTGIGALVTEQPKVNFGKQTAVSNDPLIASQNTPVAVSRQSRDADPSKTFVQEYPGQPKVNLQRPKGLEEDPAAPKDTPGAYTTTNYQTKVTDPTGKGGEVTGITPILHSFDKMNIHGTGTQDTGLREQNFPPGTHQRLSDLSFPTGSHDQFSPQPTAPSRITKTPENSPLVSETVDTSKPHEEQLRSAESDKPSNQSSYTEKISSATSAIADKAVSAKNIVASKLGYGEKEQNLTPTNELHESTQDNTTKQSSSAMDYGKKIAGTVTGTLSPVYQKVAEAGSSVISKLPGTGTGTGTATEVGTDELQGQDKGVSMTGYISEKLKPGEEDKALSEFLTEAWNPQKEEPEKENKPRGKVTESVEVTRRLGAADKGYERADSVSDNSTSNEDYTSSTYERKLQESGN
ncbi:Low temperature responsive protein [Corchorus olitorius]|uniref:Low temperature responsive protein n=1 Tax=Corchorus olitorius TaxID=93759 RepID=A0A1R3JSV8_9ROSI|nr:Low temperature responsive protein [Corchorus olitorius]